MPAKYWKVVKDSGGGWRPLTEAERAAVMKVGEVEEEEREQ